MKYHHVTYNYIVIASVALFAVNTTSAMAASVGIGTTKRGTTAQVTGWSFKNRIGKFWSSDAAPANRGNSAAHSLRELNQMLGPLPLGKGVEHAVSRTAQKLNIALKAANRRVNQLCLSLITAFYTVCRIIALLGTHPGSMSESTTIYMSEQRIPVPINTK